MDYYEVIEKLEEKELKEDLLKHLQSENFEVECSDRKKDTFLLYRNSRVFKKSVRSNKDKAVDILQDYLLGKGLDPRWVDKNNALDLMTEILSEELQLQIHNARKAEIKRLEDNEGERKRLLHSMGDLNIDLPPTSNYMLYTHKHGKADNFLYDVVNKKISKLDIKNFETIKRELLKRDNAFLPPGGHKKEPTPWAGAGFYTCFYDPKPGAPEYENLTDETGLSWTHFNMYETPKWVKDFADERDNAEIPPLILKYLQTLFLGNQATIDRVLDWFANCLFYRDPIMLCLVSTGEGVGKTMCIDLLGALQSDGRYFKPPTDVLTGVFNHSLFGKSLILFDEINAVGSAKENLRKLIGNDEVVTRRMNHDQGSKLDQPMSFACTTNVPRHVGIEGRGRRFFIPNINMDKLDESLSSKEISQLGLYTKAFNSVTTKVEEELQRDMARFGWFLYNRFEDGVVCSQAELENIKPKTFWDCQYACMNKWQQGVMDYLFERKNMEGEVLSLAQLRGKLIEVEERYLPNYSELAAFLTNHDWRGTRLAKIEEWSVFKNSKVTPIIHKDYEYELTPYDNRTKDKELDLI